MLSYCKCKNQVNMEWYGSIWRVDDDIILTKVITKKINMNKMIPLQVDSELRWKNSVKKNIRTVRVLMRKLNQHSTVKNGDNCSQQLRFTESRKKKKKKNKLTVE